MGYSILHAADLHLDSPLCGLQRYEGAPVERIRGASRRALTNLVDHCLKSEVRLLLLAGDLFDGDWRDYSTGLFFCKQMSRLREAEIPVVFVRGNHDAESRVQKALRMPSNVRELSVEAPETVEFSELGVCVHGQGYAERDLRRDLASGYPPPVPGALNLGLLHTALTGRAGHEPYAPCRRETLTGHGYDYWALGHVHQREVIAEAPWVVFPGNLQGRSARETGAKGATEIGVDGDRIVSVEHRSFDVARWEVLVVDAGGAEHDADVYERIRRALLDALTAAEGRLLALRVMVSGRTGAHATLFGDRTRVLFEVRALGFDAAGDDVWIESVKLDTLPELDLEALRQRDDPLGHLARSLSRLSQDPEELSQLSEVLASIRTRLPAELREGPDRIDLVSPEALGELAADVERLLLSRVGASPEPEDDRT